MWTQLIGVAKKNGALSRTLAKIHVDIADWSCLKAGHYLHVLLDPLRNDSVQHTIISVDMVHAGYKEKHCQKRWAS